MRVSHVKGKTVRQRLRKKHGTENIIHEGKKLHDNMMEVYKLTRHKLISKHACQAQYPLVPIVTKVVNDHLRQGFPGYDGITFGESQKKNKVSNTDEFLSKKSPQSQGTHIARKFNTPIREDCLPGLHKDALQPALHLL
jgi:hypothetical protein